jgi:hypothetical protein
LSAEEKAARNASSDDGGSVLDRFDVRSIVAGFIASGIATVLVSIVDQFRAAGAQIRSSFVTAGSTIGSAGGSFANTIVTDVLSIPFDILEGLAEAAGPFAPIVVPLAWAVAVAVIAGVLWGIWRVLGWL